MAKLSGGLAGLAGALLGALWVIGLPVLLGDTREMELFTSGAGLLLVLMYLPGGLIQLVHWARDALLRLPGRRRPALVASSMGTAPEVRLPTPTSAVGAWPEATADGAALATSGVSVRFGGRLAVDEVDLVVGSGELVGLIGANGSGKTTLMNAIGGFVRSAGRVALWGRDLTGLSPARRVQAELGASLLVIERRSCATTHG